MLKVESKVILENMPPSARQDFVKECKLIMSVSISVKKKNQIFTKICLHKMKQIDYQYITSLVTCQKWVLANAKFVRLIFDILKLIFFSLWIFCELLMVKLSIWHGIIQSAFLKQSWLAFSLPLHISTLQKRNAELIVLYGHFFKIIFTQKQVT